VLFICITRLASNEVFSPSDKIHREVRRAKDLLAPPTELFFLLSYIRPGFFVIFFFACIIFLISFACHVATSFACHVATSFLSLFLSNHVETCI
jgi:hypothetical protein